MKHPEAFILSELPFGIISVSADQFVEYVNNAARHLLTRFVARSESWEPSDGIPGRLQHALEALERLPASFSIESLQVDVVEGAEGRRILTVRDMTVLDHELAAERDRRRAAERTIDEKQEFIQTVLDNVSTGIVACDETGTLRLFNRATRTFHGLPETPLPPEEWAEYYDLYYPDGVTPLRKQDIPLYRAFRGEVVRDVEMVIAPRGGMRRTLLASGRPMFNRDGHKIGAVIAMRDITHRKLATRRVQEAFRHFRTLFNDAPIAYHEIDCQAVIKRVNRSECRLLGRTRADIIGRHPWEFVADSEQEDVKKVIADTLAGLVRPATDEREYVTSDGRHIIVELHENLIVDERGKITGIRTAMLDITDRKRHEQQAQEIIRERYGREQAEAASAEIRSILERIGDAYMAFDTEWRYTYLNRKAAELALMPASELLGKRVWDEFPDSVHTAFYTESQRALREQISRSFENYYAPLGKWFENTVYPSPSGVAVFYRDVTDRKRTQQALEKRTMQLAQKNAELEAFAYMASHDLQEPLRVIHSYTSLLSSRYCGALDEDADTFIRYVTEGVTRMQELIADLLTLCRAGTLDTKRVCETSATAALGYAVRDLATAMNESGASVHYEQLPCVRVVESQLVQLFQNLLANAIKYRSESAPVITVSATRVGAVWQFSIADNGCGFEMSQAEQIFRPFKRLRRDRPGSGIGLAICKKIVESRGGRIWAESAVDSGAIFYFTIPDEVPTPDETA